MSTILFYMETQNVEIWALRTLRSGFLYLLVAVIMGIVAVLAGLISIIAAFGFMTAAPHGPSAFAGVIGAVATLLILLLVAVGIALYAIFGKIRPGMRQLSEVDSGFRICYTGTTLMLVGLVIMVLGIIVVVAVFAAVGSSPETMRGAVIGGLTLFGVLLIGIIIGLIGDILTFVVGAFKLHSRYQNSLYMVAGILFVIDILLMLLGLGGILTAVGYILMYMALGDTINKLSTATATLAQA
jgi:hypothetical protein